MKNFMQTFMNKGMVALFIGMSMVSCDDLNKKNTSEEGTREDMEVNATEMDDNSEMDTDANTTGMSESEGVDVNEAVAEETPAVTKNNKLGMPSNEELQKMAKKTMMDFNDAVQKKDFSDFYNTISAEWQAITSPAQLKEGYKVFIDKNTTLNVVSIDATITSTPVINQDSGFDMLILNGRYETTPRPAKFTFKWLQNGMEWKLGFVSVDTK